jgi:hypothetical protein
MALMASLCPSVLLPHRNKVNLLLFIKLRMNVMHAAVEYFYLSLYNPIL